MLDICRTSRRVASQHGHGTLTFIKIILSRTGFNFALIAPWYQRFVSMFADFVNDEISRLKKQKKALPKNLHILLSNWGSWTLPNPYGLPVTNVIPRHTSPAEIEKLVSDGSTICPSKHGEWGCQDCFRAGINCWAKGTKQILFPEH